MNRRRSALVLAAVLALMGGAAHAKGQLQARQTGVDLLPGVRGGRLVLGNAGDAEVAAQVRVYAWTQDGDGDRLVPSNDLAVSPPVAKIPAGGEQLVRIVRTSSTAPAREMAYRVVVDELPGDPGTEVGSAVQVRMRYLIPVFVRVADPAPVAVQCRIEQNQLACANRGGVAAQFGASKLVAADGRTMEITGGLLGYVLAGSARRFELDSKLLGNATAWRKLEVRLNGQPATLDLSATP
ncbi:molecular chaperone [Lysobacter koreensis]|uniref:Molecular chaperone n=1 Tax=Lysobacter koreensis TaxID=266122 RepID=A0ABW2YPZ7_9GAMM